MTEVVLNVESVIANTLATRESASKLFEIILSNSSLQTAILDFSAVEFMSRSFADQFIKEQSRIFQSDNIVVQVQNVPVDIMDLIQAVARTQDKKRLESKNIPVLKIDDYNTLCNFMMSI